MTKEQWQTIVDEIKIGKITPSISDYGAIMVDGMKMPQKMVKKIMTPELRRLAQNKRQHTISHQSANDELKSLSECVCGELKFKYNGKYNPLKKLGI